jgi:hypothetical protein
MTGKREQWLARLADPAGLNPRWNPQPFDSTEHGQILSLLELAHRHNVRPSLAINLQALLRESPDSVMRQAEGTAIDAIHAEIGASKLADVGRAVLLAQTAENILKSVGEAALPAVMVKGADFARAAYGGLQNRTFSDIDILCRSDAQQALGGILAAAGFEEQITKASRQAHTERSWVKRDGVRGTILVEVHTDLVHAPELRSAQTLTWQLYAAPESGGVTPAARLILAALHGATSHLFGRLQYVVDGLMVGRMGVDPLELSERADRSGARLATFTMLRLAADIFEFTQAEDLMRAVAPVRFGGIERHLITTRSVLGGKGSHRWRLLPQRHLYRRLLSANGHRGKR